MSFARFLMCGFYWVYKQTNQSYRDEKKTPVAIWLVTTLLKLMANISGLTERCWFNLMFTASAVVCSSVTVMSVINISCQPHLHLLGQKRHTFQMDVPWTTSNWTLFYVLIGKIQEPKVVSATRAKPTSQWNLLTEAQHFHQ